MRKEDCIELFKLLPPEAHPQVNFILHNQAVLSVDAVARFEATYIVFRGREGGTTDEGRAFFVPYEEISYVRLERVVRLGELKMMYGEAGYQDLEDRLAGKAEPAGGAKPDTQTPTPGAPTLAEALTDPAAIAKQNLLDRIRAARAGVGATAGKIGSNLGGNTGRLGSNVAGHTGKLDGGGNK